MEAITLRLLRRRQYSGGDAFDLLTDYATGTLDTIRPLNERPIRWWEGLPQHEGHLAGAHLSAAHLDGLLPDGHVSGAHLRDEHLSPAAILIWTTEPLYFGLFAFAARAGDAQGNQAAQPYPSITCLVNSSPRPAEALAKTEYVPATQRLTLSLTPSPDL